VTAPVALRQAPPAAPELQRLSVVVVSFNVAPLLRRCLTSLRRASAEVTSAGGLGVSTVDVTVVDNASSDGSVELVRREFPDVRLLANGDNRGFGAACNQGTAGAGDAVLFLNPDAELLPGALGALLWRLQARPRAAVVGPRLIYPGGGPQPARRRFPSPLTLLLESTPLQWRFPHLPILGRYRCSDRPEGVAEAVDWLSGAALMVRTAAFRQVGGFDPTYFMYFEELDLCRRLAAYGWQTWYEPAATVVHHHSQSADQDLPAKDRHFYRSKYRYAARHWGTAIARGLRYAAGALFAAELALQARRGDAAAVRRYAALVRWHLHGEA
jgi:N-acetylglucosaminyl-diphospho-decaprenol L-rhamnosyltransferase